MACRKASVKQGATPGQGEGSPGLAGLGLDPSTQGTVGCLFSCEVGGDRLPFRAREVEQAFAFRPFFAGRPVEVVDRYRCHGGVYDDARQLLRRTPRGRCSCPSPRTRLRPPAVSAPTASAQSARPDLLPSHGRTTGTVVRLPQRVRQSLDSRDSSHVELDGLQQRQAREGPVAAQRI